MKRNYFNKIFNHLHFATALLKANNLITVISDASYCFKKYYFKYAIILDQQYIVQCIELQ